jgi:hypothetical protein
MSNSEGIQAVPSLFAFFYEEVSQALRITGCETTQETEHYIVNLLDGFVRLSEDHIDEVGFDRPAAKLLEEAMNAEGARRIEVYRRLGDTSLYSCGFFEQKLSRSAVGTRYYSEVGRTAYRSLSEMISFREPGSVFKVVYDELYQKFDDVVSALRLVGIGKRSESLVDKWASGELDDQSMMRAGFWVNEPGQA